MFQHSKLMLAVFFTFAIGFANETADAEAASTPAADANVPYEDKVQQDRTKEWMDVVSSLSASKTKIKAKEDTIKDIIHHKQKAKTKAEAEALVAELLREHKELTKLTEDYNTSAQLLKYRYPDVGLTEKRKYEKLEMKSLVEFEDSQTIEGQIKKTVSKLKTHYGVKEEKKAKEETVKKPGFDNNNLAQPRILKK
jgi:hypothetical protein